MKYTQLGSSDLKLSNIGLGSWSFGGGGWIYSWGKQKDIDSIKVIEQAIAAGVNWIDSAPIYGFGHSEKIIAKAKKTLNISPIIATKCGLTWTKKRKVYGNLSRQSILKEVEDSLQRLKVDVIDLYQIHWPKPQEEIEEAWETIAELKAQGKIKYAGVSNFNIEQLKRVSKIMKPTSLQSPYSLLDKHVETEILPYCIKNNIAFLAYSPLQKGLLTGKFNPKYLANLDKDDHRRKRDPMFREPLFSQNLKKVLEYNKKAEQQEKTMMQFSLDSVLNTTGINAAIVGIRNLEQLKGVVS